MRPPPPAIAPRGLIVAAPGSGSGKTVVALGLIRHLATQGRGVASVKVGPDYIDPAFHAAASGRPCDNLDLWAMRPETLSRVRVRLMGSELAVCEGAMGLFDGAADGRGSTADVAAATGWPVILVVDAGGQGASVAALIEGFARHRPDVRLAGVVFNRIGGDNHKRILTDAVRRAIPEVAVLGAIPRSDALSLPERHLGLVQAGEHAALEGFLDAAAREIATHVDVAALDRLARPWDGALAEGDGLSIPPLGQRIALACDSAFAFRYRLAIDGWRARGAEIVPFSPLADDAPDPSADAVYLPGGYPELQAGRLAAAERFLGGLKAAASRGAAIFGECGGYMVLGEGLEDADGRRHAMAGLLPLETSFARRRLHLGYRRARLAVDCPFGRSGARFRGHEFHYAAILKEGPGTPLFECSDAAGRSLGAMGRVRGRTMGSFVHLIDRDGDD